MNSDINVLEELKSILNRYKKNEISPEFAKSELLYMIKAASNIAELNAAGEGYEQVSLIKKRPWDV